MFSEEDIIKFKRQPINLDRLFALCDLITACKKENIAIKNVVYFQNGFGVMFEGFEGDVVLHDNSYGRLNNEWESYRFPWDEDDVSVHSTEELVKLLSELKGEK